MFVDFSKAWESIYMLLFEQSHVILRTAKLAISGGLCSTTAEQGFTCSLRDYFGKKMVRSLCYSRLYLRSWIF